jgi:flagellar biosynthesis protein FlhF
MMIKRFFAAEARQALQQVSEELGSDALILSNRRVSDGVEIIAALDYEDELLGDEFSLSEKVRGQGERQLSAPTDAGEDVTGPVVPDPLSGHSLQAVQEEMQALRGMLEAPLSRLAWAEMGRQQPHRAELVRRLLALGLHNVVANHVADQVGDIQTSEQGWRAALSWLEHRIPVADDELTTAGGVVALVGPTGVGKTTTVAKLAARFAMCHGRRNVALVTMDCYRIGAHEQLRTYGRLLGVPVHTAVDAEELHAVINHMRDRKLILIDTAGASQRDMRLLEQLEMLNVDDTVIKRYLVLSANGSTALADEVVEAFKRTALDSCIVTKLDEATRIGGLLSVLLKHKLPVTYLGDGQRVPDDLHPAKARRLLSQAVTLMQRSEDTQSDSDWLQAIGTIERDDHVCANV